MGHIPIPLDEERVKIIHRLLDQAKAILAQNEALLDMLSPPVIMNDTGTKSIIDRPQWERTVECPKCRMWSLAKTAVIPCAGVFNGKRCGYVQGSAQAEDK